MRNVVGVLFLLVGLGPFLFIFWVWTRHMYTVGFSADPKGIVVISLLVLFELFCVVFGLRLLLTGNRKQI